MSVFKTIVLRHPMGLPTHRAAELAVLAARFRSHIVVWKEELSADGKSPGDLMALGAEEGTGLKFVLEGEDAEEALETIYKYLAYGVKPMNRSSPDP